VKKVILAMLFVSAVYLSLEAQPTFQKMVGSESGDEGYAVLQTRDSGYIVAGITHPGNKHRAVYLVRFDSVGNHIWTKTLGEEGESTCKSISPTTDGGYILGGYFSQAGTYQLLIKIDAEGNQQWSRTYGEKSGNSLGYSALQTVDGGYIICGSSTGKGDGDAYIVKTDAAGNPEWQNTYGGQGSDVAYSISVTTDGGYIVAGQSGNADFSNANIYLLKLNTNGAKEWSKTFGGNEKNFDQANCVRQTADGGFIVTGDIGNNDDDVYLLKTDVKGKKLWDRSFGGAGEDHGRSVEQTTDGGYIIGGFTRSFKGKATDFDFYLIKTDASGDKQWDHTYGGWGDDYGFSCKPASDGGYIFAGYSDSDRNGWNDVMLVKTDANGK
jgi:hypothetical protein